MSTRLWRLAVAMSVAGLLGLAITASPAVAVADATASSATAAGGSPGSTDEESATPDQAAKQEKTSAKRL